MVALADCVDSGNGNGNANGDGNGTTTQTSESKQYNWGVSSVFDTAAGIMMFKGGEWWPEVQDSYTPVCSLTVATDRESGTLTPDASAVAPYYEPQVAVYDIGAIDDGPDQFASLLTGL